MSAPKRAKRTRLSPQKRRAMILDHAAVVVAEDGVKAATMDRIARQAQVSKSLLYAYFDNVSELMRELLQRELRRLRRKQAQAANEADDFRGMVRAVTHEYIDYIAERGLIIQRLQAEPSIAEGRDPTDYGRRDAVRFVAKVVSRNFDLPMDLAVACTDISFGIPAAAGHFMESADNDPKWVEDITVEMIAGSIEAVVEAYKKDRLSV